MQMGNEKQTLHESQLEKSNIGQRIQQYGSVHVKKKR